MSGHPSLPAELLPQDDASFTLESRRTVPVQRYKAVLSRSLEKRSIVLDRAYSAKPLVIVDKQPIFPEIALLALFKAAGWQGVWVDVPHRKYFDRMPNESKGISLPTHVNKLVTRVAANNRQSKAGCWDLMLWDDKMVVFVAAKAPSPSEELSGAQIGWIDAALRSGLLPSQFIIVDWEYRSVVVKKRPPNPRTTAAP